MQRILKRLATQSNWPKTGICGGNFKTICCELGVIRSWLK